MTNKEAIEIIKKDALYNPEVAKIAIKALKREKVGHWIQTNDKTSPQCSECGAITYKWSYCPICGAKMEE